MMFFSGRQGNLLRMVVHRWGSALGQWVIFGRKAKSEPSKALINYGRTQLSLEILRLWLAFMFFSGHVAQEQKEKDCCHDLLGILTGQDKRVHTPRMLAFQWLTEGSRQDGPYL